jgi:hypothetical protein
MEKEKYTNPLETLYAPMVAAGLNISLYGSSLKQTSLKIIQLNNLRDDARGMQVIEDLILRLIDRGFIRFVPTRESMNYPMTFLFSRYISNSMVSAFLQPKNTFLFHNDISKVFSDTPPFPIHPLMKKERDQTIKFLSGAQYQKFPSWFASFPIDGYYVKNGETFP